MGNMMEGRNRSRDRTIAVPFRSGHVVWLSKAATWLNRDKARPFVLATNSGGQVPETLVYGSSQDTEKQFGAAFIKVDPVREGVNRNGLVTPTYFYPGALLACEATALPAPSGFLGKSLVALRGQLRFALGIGEGTCLRPDAPVGSRRGRIIQLHPALSRLVRTSFAVVLTEPRYSRAANYQVILPVVRDAEGWLDEHALHLPSRIWPQVFRELVDSVVLPIPATQSIWYRTGTIRETEYVLDDDSLREIDERLCSYFSL